MADKRIEKTKAALKAAVLELASQQEFSSVSIAEIVRRAGIGYPTFFRHYASKEDLLADTIGELVEELVELVLPPLLEGDTADASLRLCRYVDERRSFCRMLLASSAEASVRRQMVMRAEARASELHGQVHDDLPPGLVIPHVVGAMIGLMTWWLDQGEAEGGETISVEAMGALVDRLVMRPVHFSTD